MKLFINISILFFVTTLQIQAQFLSAINFEIGKEISYKANLNEGKFIDDLSWAWSSQNACFPETQKHKFTGKHILFTGIMPTHSNVEVIVTPADKNANFSVYGYQINLNDDFVVPNLPHCITCEADYKWDYAKKHKPKQNHIRKIRDFTAIDSSYRLVIGVTAANGLTEADFIISIITKEYY